LKYKIQMSDVRVAISRQRRAGRLKCKIQMSDVRAAISRQRRAGRLKCKIQMSDVRAAISRQRRAGRLKCKKYITLLQFGIKSKISDRKSLPAAGRCNLQSFYSLFTIIFSITSISIWVRKKQSSASDGLFTMGSFSLKEVFNSKGIPVFCLNASINP
jgi:hypothetical protein